MQTNTIYPGPAYAGIGSRETPQIVGHRMVDWARKLSEAGLTLRSGGADGADTYFEAGCKLASGTPDLYLPWSGFNGRQHGHSGVDRAALELAATLHPAWARLTHGARKLHARNCYQVLGITLSQPVAFVLCWTPDGAESEAERTSRTGGTGTAIVLASRHDVPVFNLQRNDAEIRLSAFLDVLLRKYPKKQIDCTP